MERACVRMARSLHAASNVMFKYDLK
uniref:Uncharacterized protein n=1 Tax=Anguilla anguilla TaxID=7936 RepID=A0A0E9QGB5_ANGAN